MMKLCKSLCIYTALILVAESAFADLPLSERYPGPWKEDFNVDITKALVAKGIKECGEYKYRPSALDRDEYLVHCTRDGKRWSAYLVWPKIKEIMGPYAPDPSVK